MGPQSYCMPGGHQDDFAWWGLKMCDTVTDRSHVVGWVNWCQVCGLVMYNMHCITHTLGLLKLVLSILRLRFQCFWPFCVFLFAILTCVVFGPPYYHLPYVCLCFSASLMSLVMGVMGRYIKITKQVFFLLLSESRLLACNWVCHHHD